MTAGNTARPHYKRVALMGYFIGKNMCFDVVADGKYLGSKDDWDGKYNRSGKSELELWLETITADEIEWSADMDEKDLALLLFGIEADDDDDLSALSPLVQ